MIQYVIVGILLIWAIFYIARSIRKQFRNKSGCATNCGNCGVDFSEIKANQK